ncbi:unnamed protein product [Adineta ricciae]|uniref:Ubiquitin-like domain-containing protein n=1 Tax=Adineta ricciae TaxID=249248 RepID=A0A816AFN7_ADIRI|nr:unnamed protein product [Adineta ricciae]CAF1595225.1 unnamed protein product [Adineta ricciae]
MSLTIRPCAIQKCDSSSCATCHCCGNDICLDHLKQHKDQLNAKLLPLADEINILSDNFQHFKPDSTPAFIHLDQWRIAAHQTIDLFYQHMHDQLSEEIKSKPLEKLRKIQDILGQLIQKQGATQDNIASLNRDIQLLKQEINRARNTSINLQSLVIDKNTILESNSAHRIQRDNQNEQDDLVTLHNGNAFQIFVQIITGRQILMAVKPSTTIADLKRKIQDKTGVPVDSQNLTCRGKFLNDEYNVAAYDIFKHSIVCMTIRQRTDESNAESS